MSNTITIGYPQEAPVNITLRYTIDLADNMQTINCSVEEVRVPLWLQMKKFSIFSFRSKDGYVPLFNEVNNSKNLDTALFIDLVFASIMAFERMKIYITS